MQMHTLVLVLAILTVNETPILMSVKVHRIDAEIGELSFSPVKNPERIIKLVIAANAEIKDLHGNITLEEAASKIAKGQQFLAFISVDLSKKPPEITKLVLDSWSGNHALKGKVVLIDTKTRQITIETPLRKVLTVEEYSELIFEEGEEKTRSVDIKDIKVEDNIEVVAIVHSDKPEKRDETLSHFTIMSAVFYRGLRPPDRSLREPGPAGQPASGR